MRAAAIAVAVAALAVAGSASSARPDRFVLHRLVSDRGDAQLVNAWGLAASAEGPWWVANEARSSSTLPLLPPKRTLALPRAIPSTSWVLE